jgi:hypothetical protein
MTGRFAGDRLKLVLTVTLTLLLLPMMANAQDWKFENRNDGVAFNTYLYHQGGEGFSLGCSGRNHSVPGLLPMYYEGTTWTRPDEIHLSFSGRSVGRYTSQVSRNDVLLVIGAGAYRLPRIAWDDYTSDWSLILQARGPMFDAISAVRSFEIRSDAGTVILGTSGFASGYANLINTCRRQFAAARQPWRSGPMVVAAQVAPAAPVAPVTMRQAAEADVAKGCNGPSTYEPDAFLSAEIDGDGVADVVLDWRKIKCSGTFSQPFCGASMCSADVYLSGSYARTNAPKQLLAAGVRLQSLSNGNMAVGVGGSLADCYGIGADNCEFLYYWNGADLVGLP